MGSCSRPEIIIRVAATSVEGKTDNSPSKRRWVSVCQVDLEIQRTQGRKLWACFLKQGESEMRKGGEEFSNKDNSSWQHEK